MAVFETMPEFHQVAVGPRGRQKIFLVSATESKITIKPETGIGQWTYSHCAPSAEAAIEAADLMIREVGQAIWSAAIETAIHETVATLNPLR